MPLGHRHTFGLSPPPWGFRRHGHAGNAAIDPALTGTGETVRVATHRHGAHIVSDHGCWRGFHRRAY